MSSDSIGKLQPSAAGTSRSIASHVASNDRALRSGTTICDRIIDTTSTTVATTPTTNPISNPIHTFMTAPP